mgnify:CR=1 FL=1
MRKILSLIVFTIILSGSLFSQECLNDVYYTIMNQNAPGKAKNMLDKKCMPGNEGSADAWLMKANVYLRYYDYELNQKKQNPNYVLKNPEILVEVVEAFKKALEIDPKVEPKSGMIGPVKGQKVCGADIHDLGVRYLKEKNYDKAIELILIAQKCYAISIDELKPDHEGLFWSYVDLSDAYQGKGDVENYKASLKKALNFKKPIPSIYVKTYKMFLEDKDTVQCGKVIATAKKAIPDTMLDSRLMIANIELNYLYMTHQFDTLKNRALEILDKTPFDPDHLNAILDITDYMSNINELQQSEQIIDKYLGLFPTNFEMTYQKGFLYLKKAADIDVQAESVRLSKTISNADKIKMQQDLKVQKDNLYKVAHEWFEKAYNINNTDKETIKMLYRVKKTIGITVSPEFEAQFKEAIQ